MIQSRTPTSAMKSLASVCLVMPDFDLLEGPSRRSVRRDPRAADADRSTMSEIAGLRWSEIDFRSWRRFASGRADKERQATRYSYRRHGTRDTAGADKDCRSRFCFWKGASHSVVCRVARSAGQRIAELNPAPLPDWVRHDFAVLFRPASLGLVSEPHIIEAVLDHVTGVRAALPVFVVALSTALRRRGAGAVGWAR